MRMHLKVDLVEKVQGLLLLYLKRTCPPKSVLLQELKAHLLIWLGLKLAQELVLLWLGLKLAPELGLKLALELGLLWLGLHLLCLIHRLLGLHLHQVSSSQGGQHGLTSLGFCCSCPASPRTLAGGPHVCRDHNTTSQILMQSQSPGQHNENDTYYRSNHRQHS